MMCKAKYAENVKQIMSYAEVTTRHTMVSF
jgi:hypothetical protein